MQHAYGADWHELRGNERLTIEILFYNCEGLVRNGTYFKQYIHNYIHTKDKAYLLAVVDQVKNHSNKDNDPRIQIHRNVCAELINSTESPFYVLPGHPLLPLNPVKVVLGKTVIPLGFSQYSSFFPINQYLDKPNEDYCIWRTQMDGKVRDAHRAYEGRILNVFSKTVNSQIAAKKVTTLSI